MKQDAVQAVADVREEIRNSLKAANETPPGGDDQLANIGEEGAITAEYAVVIMAAVHAKRHVRE